MEDLEPLSAMGLFVVTRRLEVYQTIIFDYFDSESYYYGLSEDMEKLEAELRKLAASMQSFLDEEEVILNGARVRPRVVGVDLGFRSSPEEPFITYFIYFRGKPVKGVNYYENIYENTVAEYPITAYWFFPPRSSVGKVEASGEVEIIGSNIVVLRVDEGEKIYGYERIEFTL
ncbi:hypothetical protein [Thermofilum pendens]|uniref:Uncharacterized protein n=1 Tax=Thermofilum pendens (strain DSM 2475 / Hrk 5) TaxID=368408 RepID=A1RYE9_THEPD|nr:hypothetical protein [Thermofilum pendens]ABL78229.1 conserved hypothetical protein [Thermofilum pendens Hrk 5]